MTLFEFMEYHGLTLTVYADGCAEFEHYRTYDQLVETPLPEHDFDLRNVQVLLGSPALRDDND